MTEGSSITLKLEGRVVGPWVEELRETWSAAAKLPGAKSVQVDMNGVSYADQRGADLLLHMEDLGASLAQCSDFIRQLLHVNEGKEAARKGSKRPKKES
jgi:hypothetical protein